MWEKKRVNYFCDRNWKTILCALDVRAYSPDKFLFIVHNEGILNRAIEEFKKVFPYEDESNFGLLTESEKIMMLNSFCNNSNTF